MMKKVITEVANLIKLHRGIGGIYKEAKGRKSQQIETWLGFRGEFAFPKMTWSCFGDDMDVNNALWGFQIQEDVTCLANYPIMANSRDAISRARRTWR